LGILFSIFLYSIILVCYFIKFILRVIRNQTITQTEKGKFYLYQNPNHSQSLSLVPWGNNLFSSVGIKNISKEERDMIKLPKFQYSVIIGLILSDASLGYSNRSINVILISISKVYGNF
jgi:hypothetical protein